MHRPRPFLASVAGIAGRAPPSRDR